QFQQAQKMEAIGRLAGGVAHDFNNLLTVINGYGDLLLAVLATDDSNRPALAAIREAGERAARLTSQLLAFSRKAIVEPKVLDLNDVVEHSQRLLSRLVGEDIHLITVLDPAVPRIRIDPGQLEQVIMNLLVNARDAMPTGGQLTIETHPLFLSGHDLAGHPALHPGRYAELVVSDTGCGMSDETLTRLFEPFFTTKGQGKGTGLGLAVVHGVVEQAGGLIRVHSRVGQGTTFRILFPAVPESTGGSAGGVASPLRGSETVLLVEDEDAVRTVSRIGLESQGYVVLTAESGPDAVRLAEEYPGPIHLLVTDVVMPGMGGRQVVETIRGRRPGLRVLYMSGYTDDAVVRHGVSDATDAFLQKPFTPLTLARKVRQVLDAGQ
ncbi:MAG: ATP-binding protein, partial [Gemmataceae bacterium]